MCSTLYWDLLIAVVEEGDSEFFVYRIISTKFSHRLYLSVLLICKEYFCCMILKWMHRRHHQSKFLYVYILYTLSISLHLYAYICLYYIVLFFFRIKLFPRFFCFQTLSMTNSWDIYSYPCMQMYMILCTIRKWKQIGNQSSEIPSLSIWSPKKLVLRYTAFYLNILYFLLPPFNDNIFLQIKPYLLN